MPILEILGYERVMRIRILRQADVLHLMYMLNDRFMPLQKQTAFDFYEPMTTHDSSLSFCIHSIMAAELDMEDKAFDYFSKTSRLDIDGAQDATSTGIHGAALVGTWQAVTNGFGGVRVNGDTLSLKPVLPRAWQELSFQVHIQDRVVRVSINKQGVSLHLLRGEPLEVILNGVAVRLDFAGVEH